MIGLIPAFAGIQGQLKCNLCKADSFMDLVINTQAVGVQGGQWLKCASCSPQGVPAFEEH